MTEPCPCSLSLRLYWYRVDPAVDSPCTTESYCCPHQTGSCWNTPWCCSFCKTDKKMSCIMDMMMKGHYLVKKIFNKLDHGKHVLRLKTKRCVFQVFRPCLFQTFFMDFKGIPVRTFASLSPPSKSFEQNILPTIPILKFHMWYVTGNTHIFWPYNVSKQQRIWWAIKDSLSRNMTKQTKWLCAQRRLGSGRASAQSDPSLCCALYG